MKLSRIILGRSNRATASDLSASTDSVNNGNSFSISKATGLELAGLFIFVAALAAVATTQHASSTHGSPAANPSLPSISSGLSAQDNSTANPAPTEKPVNTSTTSTHSVSSQTNSDGTVSTQVTVNGQPVAVPNNGSSQQTFTSPDGASTLNVSVDNRSSVGSSSNSATTFTTFNVDSSTQAYTSPGGN